jgi:hypothetical protein
MTGFAFLSTCTRVLNTYTYIERLKPPSYMNENKATLQVRVRNYMSTVCLLILPHYSADKNRSFYQWHDPYL